MDLRLTTRETAAASVVAVSGEVDNLTAPQLRDALVRAVDGGSSRVVVDLSDTDFLDSSGLGALVGGNKHAQRTGAVLAVVCPKVHLRRLFEISRLDDVLPVFDSLEAASVSAP